MSDQAKIIVITGIQASGKSTIAQLLARRFSRGVHIEADQLQRMIVSGGVWPMKPGQLVGEEAVQLRLRLRNTCLLARSFFDAGFTVVIDEIIIGDRWHHLRDDLDPYPFYLAVLAPEVEEVLRRDRNRRKPTLGQEWAYYLDAQLRDTMADNGLWLDTTDLTVEEVVDEVLNTLTP